MKGKILKKRNKYAVALLAATAATVATSFSSSAPGVMASGNGAGVAHVPDNFNPPIYTEVPHDQDTDKINIPYYHVEAGNNVSVTTDTFVEKDYNGEVDVTYNNFVVKANDTIIEDSGDIVVDDSSENAEKGEENGVTRKYKLKLSDSLKEELKNAAAAGGGGGAAPSKLEAGTNTTVEGDGTEDNKYKVNINPELTGITSITGDTLTLHGGTTAVTINNDGVDVGGKKITNLKDGDVSENSTDAVTGKQLHETNEKVEVKLDKTAERHIKPGDYTVENGTVTLKYVDADGTETGEEATISGLNPVKSIASGDEDKLTVTNNNGDITITPVVATDITKADDANKLATAGVVNTAITNATAPLADKNLSNITDDGKKVITGLGTEVVQGNGVTVTSSEDAATGKKTYTISANAAQPNFANGTNTTVEGDGTAGSPYKYNVNPALTGITSITNATTADGDGTKLTIDGDKLSVVNKKGTDTTTVTIGKDGIDAGGKAITNVADPTGDKDAANKEYVDSKIWGLKVQNGDNPAEAVTAKDKAITLKASADTSDATDTPKKGIVIAKDDEGNITLGLEKADRTTLDHAANVGNTAADGRDGKAGKDANGVVAGSAGVQGPTGQDGLNGKDLTNKVNALRNGEAGTVVYTNAAGERVVKANDGKYYKADEVKPDGNVKTETDNGGKPPVAVTPEARLVNPDGTTTGAATKLSNIAGGTISKDSKDAVNGSQLFNERVTSPVIFVDKDGNQVFKNAEGKFVTKDGAEVPAADLDKVHTKVNATNPMTLDNVASAIENTSVPNAADPNNVTFKEKLATAAANDVTKHSAVNVEDLHKATSATSDALVTKGLNFQGNLGDAIHKDLGAKLEIVGEGTVAADATTAANNIRTKNVDGKLEIGIVKDLIGITSITNATTADGAGTKLTIDGDKVSIANKQAGGATKTITIGKDGINAGGTKITNVAEGNIDKDSTDVVIGKQLHATNEKVSNLEETKLNKTDDVHVKAGTYNVDDKTGTVALPLVKGNADTATGKNVTISGIVTHASLSNTMDAYELNIEGDKVSKVTTTLKKGLAVRGAENFTPDAAAQEKGINIQATAAEGGVNIKLSDTLTKMKGITFTPAENSKEAVSLTSNGLDNGGHTITNVAAGQNDTDAVNVAQLKGIANVVGDVNNRLNRSSAQSAALAGLQTLQYDPLEPTQISAGVGYYKGSTALALGIGHYKNESTLFHVGASVNGHGDEVMANASVTWKFGSRAAESAVKDTYRQGPISASYTLQDKVSALEAQNQIQSEKINAQNQVIEDLKAQLAEVLKYIRK